MASGRTIKTLAYLVAAMTAVTFLLGLVEPWTLSLRPRSAAAQDRRSLLMPLSAEQVRWESVELVLAPQDSTRPESLPDAHVIVRSNGAIETTPLWRQRQPLPDHVLRVCAVYSGAPSDEMLGTWLQACAWAARQMNVDTRSIDLKTASPGQRQLPDLRRRLSQLLSRQSAM